MRKGEVRAHRNADGGNDESKNRKTFTGNDARLKELGYKAISRLQSLPDDPATFKELTASWPKEAKLSRRNGTTWISTPNWEMPWKAAVAAGKIKFA